MSRSIGSQRHEALRLYLIEKRKAAGLRQIDVAAKLQRYQSYITSVETGEKVLDVVELLDWAEAIGFDPHEAIKRLAKKR